MWFKEILKEVTVGIHMNQQVGLDIFNLGDDWLKSISWNRARGSLLYRFSCQSIQLELKVCYCIQACLGMSEEPLS